MDSTDVGGNPTESPLRSAGSPTSASFPESTPPHAAVTAESKVAASEEAAGLNDKPKGAHDDDERAGGEAPEHHSRSAGAAAAGQEAEAAADGAKSLDTAATATAEDDDDAAPWDTVAATEVKNIILQVLSPYFDDDAGAGERAGHAGGALEPVASGTYQAGMTGSPTMATAGPTRVRAAGSPASHGSPTFVGEDGEERHANFPGTGGGSEDTAQRYDHAKAEVWIAGMCDGIMERLVGLGKPLKFVVHAIVMRKCGAGLHVCSSCYYAPSDGWLSHSHDLSAHLYAVVTVYWCAV